MHIGSYHRCVASFFFFFSLSEDEFVTAEDTTCVEFYLKVLLELKLADSGPDAKKKKGINCNSFASARSSKDARLKTGSLHASQTSMHCAPTDSQTCTFKAAPCVPAVRRVFLQCAITSEAV